MNLNSTEILAVKSLLDLPESDLERVLQTFWDVHSEWGQNQTDSLQLLLNLSQDEAKNVVTLVEKLKDIGNNKNQEEVVTEAQAKRHPRLVRNTKPRKSDKYSVKRSSGSISKDAAMIGRSLKKRLVLQKAGKKKARYHIASSRISWEHLKGIAPPAKKWPNGLLVPVAVGTKFLVTPEGLQLPPGYADRILYGMVDYSITEEDIAAVKKNFKWAYDTSGPVTHSAMMAWRPPIIVADATSIKDNDDENRFQMSQRISLAYHLWHFIFRKKRMTVSDFCKYNKYGLSSGSIDNLLTCKNVPLVSTLQEVSKITNMSVNTLLGLKLDVVRAGHTKKLVTYMKQLI